MENKFQKVREEKRLLYEYIRGSVAYGTAFENLENVQSDIDTSGIFFAPRCELLGFNSNFTERIADEKNDNVWFEIGKWFELLCNSNPNIIESLWIPQRCILFEDAIIKEIKENRNMFLTKKVYETFGGYAKSQIKKARGLNKAIVNPVYERLTPLDFIYTFYKQGSTKIENWLEHRGLKQRYCGLVNIPNMHEVYGLYYDFGTHIEVEYGNKENFYSAIEKHQVNEIFLKTLFDYFNISLFDDIRKYEIPCYGFRGILNKDETSNELRLANIPKEAKPLCHVAYNVYGYTKHCADYKRYTEWVKNRNPNRYEMNKQNTYDVKNMYHMFRLINMCTEILNGEGVNIDRTDIDRDFLMKIRRGEFEYNEIMNLLEIQNENMVKAYQTTKLPDDINFHEINQMLIDIRKKIYK